MRRRSGWPRKRMPNMSQTSRSAQSALCQSGTADATSGSSRSARRPSALRSRGTITTACPRASSAGSGVAPGRSASARATTSSGLMSARSVPRERPLAPDVHESEREHAHEDRQLDDAEEPEPAEEHRPRVEKNHLHVEDDEEDRRQVELHREAAPRRSARRIAALEGLALHRRGPPRAEEQVHGEEEPGNQGGDHERRHDGNVLEVHGETFAQYENAPALSTPPGCPRASTC